MINWYAPPFNLLVYVKAFYQYLTAMGCVRRRAYNRIECIALAWLGKVVKARVRAGCTKHVPLALPEHNCNATAALHVNSKRLVSLERDCHMAGRGD